MRNLFQIPLGDSSSNGAFGAMRSFIGSAKKVRFTAADFSFITVFDRKSARSLLPICFRRSAKICGKYFYLCNDSF